MYMICKYFVDNIFERTRALFFAQFFHVIQKILFILNQIFAHGFLVSSIST